VKSDAAVIRPVTGGAMGQTTPLVVGDRPVHQHKCGHDCNSPYCGNSALTMCESCGGPPSIVQGLEPWRGR
jgi:hypothetical protein